MSSYAYPLLGGTMLASSVYHLLYFNGQVLGVSGIYGGAIADIVQAVRKSFASPTQEANGTAAARESSPVTEQSEESRYLTWRVSVVAGLLAGGTVLRLLRAPIESRLGRPIFEQAVVQGTSATPLASLLVGLLVGFGTNLSGGCTSGHMLCGLSRLSLRSLVATVTFFLTSVGTVQYLNPKISNPSVSNTPFDPIFAILLQLPVLLYRYIVPAITPSKYYLSVSSFFIAVHFAFALALAGMLQPSKIQGFLFLPFSDRFDPTLLFVAIGALVPLTLGWTLKVRSTEKPLFNFKFNLPSGTEIDWKLIVGAAIFGIGWGVQGVCPAPGVVNFGAYAEQWRTTGAWLLGMTGGRFLV